MERGINSWKIKNCKLNFNENKVAKEYFKRKFTLWCEKKIEYKKKVNQTTVTYAYGRRIK